MRATYMYGAGDVRVIDVPDPTIRQPTDALVRIVRACVCGSDLHPYHSMPADTAGGSVGHEFIGVVEEVGSEVTSLGRGDFVIAPFAVSCGVCEFCRAGLQTSCVNGGFWNDSRIGTTRTCSFDSATWAASPRPHPVARSAPRPRRPGGG